MVACMGNMKSTPVKAARRSREEWVAEIARWRRSGLGSAEYAQQHGLNQSTLLGWSFKVGAAVLPATQQPSAPAAFLPVHVRKQQEAVVAAASRIEIVLVNGRSVRVVGAVDVGELARVLAAAEGGAGC
jgi:hypothetical protein